MTQIEAEKRLYDLENVRVRVDSIIASVNNVMNDELSTDETAMLILVNLLNAEMESLANSINSSAQQRSNEFN